MLISTLMLIFFLAVNNAHAQTASPEISLKTDANEANITKSVTAKKELELELKRSVLLRVLDISTIEIKNFNEKISKIEKPSEDLEIIKDEISKDLDSFSQYITDTYKEVEDAKDLQTIYKIASDIKNWREDKYNLEAKNIFNLILVWQTQEITNIANNRLDKISSAYKKIIETDEEKSKIFEDSSNAIKEAEKYSALAKEVFIKKWNIIKISESPAPSTKPSPTNLISATPPLASPTPTTTPTPPTSITPTPSPSTRTYIENTISSLKDAYKGFLLIIKTQ